MPPIARPSHLSDLAERTLRALASAGLGHTISVGGALGLQHYLDYRSTDDVDAWWNPAATAEDRERVLRTIEESLRPLGEVRTRAWGEVVSLDLKVGAKTIFSFQVAARSAQLAPTTNLPWADVSLDSLPDLVASKMVALVERGAPRDFRDIHALCMAGMTTAEECWRLWAERQAKAKSDVDRYRARLAVETHIARIAQHHPLDAVGDPEQRAAAQRLRAWFSEEFLDALVD